MPRSNGGATGAFEEVSLSSPVAGGAWKPLQHHSPPHSQPLQPQQSAYSPTRHESPAAARHPAAQPAAQPAANGPRSARPDDEAANLRAQLQRLKAQMLASSQQAEEETERAQQAAAAQAASLQREQAALQASLAAAQQELLSQQGANQEVRGYKKRKAAPSVVAPSNL